MDMRYQEFCFADPRFYDSPDRVRTDRGRFGLAAPSTRPGWSSGERRGWFYLHPEGLELPRQGWKLHVSSTLDDAERVLGIVADHCFSQKLSFKFVPTRFGLLARNLKYADRSGSGKFITVYPTSDESAIATADALDAALAGTPGPYILSDLRWNAGPVFTRYGGFLPRFCLDAQGERVPAIEQPDGELVPDAREPRFAPPSWVPLPPAMQRHLTALGPSAPPDDFPYRIKHPLHFSNGGGVYLAEDLRSGRTVVLKEARPHAGLDPTGTDAVTRLRTEASYVKRLSDEPSVVGWVDSFHLFEHAFLAEEYVEGQTLNKEMVGRYPLIRASASAEDIEDFTTWALRILRQVEAAVDRLHARGVVFGDLHPNNMMVAREGEVVLVDLEMAHDADEIRDVTMGAPGYVPPDGRQGAARDRYALACLKLAMFFPLNTVLPLDASKVRQYVDIVESIFPVPPGFRDELLAELGDCPPADPATRRTQALVSAWGSESSLPGAPVRDLLAGAILADASPDRTDRLFPGDITQFAENAIGIAHGAAGVLVTLDAAGVRIPGSHLDWFLGACRSPERFGHHVGLYDGAAGAAVALARMGLVEAASTLAAGLLDLDLTACAHHLYGGLAGLGLAHLAVAGMTGDSTHVQRACEVGAELQTRSRPEPHDALISTPGARAGLMWGQAGHALLHVRLYELTEDEAYLDAAHAAVLHDLAACVVSPEDGSLQVNEGWRVLPYLATGSAGIGLAVLRVLAHVDDARLSDALEGIHRATRSRFVIGAGLLNGRAGLIEYLISARDAGRPAPDGDALIAQHVRDLSWHATSRSTGASIVGDQLMRISHDLGTGTAGVLHVLRRATGARTPPDGIAPFLDPPPVTTADEGR
jgi:tRNA A-37 threonylcarbamoyl transferase component Bud32